MSIRWYLELKCIYCGEKNPKKKNPKDIIFWQDEYILYTPGENKSFVCDFCGKENKIEEKNIATKIIKINKTNEDKK